MNNTKKSGAMRFVVFKEADRFYGICLDFNIIVDGLSPIEVEKRVVEISHDHLNTVRKNNLDDSLLNRHASKEYWNMYKKFQERNSIIHNKINAVVNKTRPVLSSYVQSYPMTTFA